MNARSKKTIVTIVSLAVAMAFLAGSPVLGQARASQTDVSLVCNGASEHRIVLHRSASPSEKHAADELQSHIEACTGVKLSVVEGKPQQAAPMIVLGCGET